MYEEQRHKQYTNIRCIICYGVRFILINYIAYVRTGVIMKSNKITIISSLFLMTALCGCTTQSVDKAKEIEESNTYVYKYEYETNTEGQAETQYHEEKPSFDDFETVTKGTIASLRNKTWKSVINFNDDVYDWEECDCSSCRCDRWHKDWGLCR